MVSKIGNASIIQIHNSWSYLKQYDGTIVGGNGENRFTFSPSTSKWDSSYTDWKLDNSLTEGFSYSHSFSLGALSGASVQLQGSEYQLLGLAGGWGLQGSYNFETSDWSLAFGRGFMFDTPTQPIAVSIQAFGGLGISNEGVIAKDTFTDKCYDLSFRCGLIL